jgi:type IV pilus assembly protein PilF
MKKSLSKTMIVAAVAIALAVSGCVGIQADQLARSEALRDLGEAHLVDGNPRAALKELLEAETHNPADPRIQNLMALAYEGLERLDLATQHLENALSLKPDFSEARNNLAVVLIKQERYAEAITHLEQLSRDLLYLTPHHAACNLGWAYHRTGRQDLAEQSYRQALAHYEKKGIAKDQTYIRILVGLGRVLLEQGRAEPALEPLKAAAGLVPTRAEVQFELGRAYAAAGDAANARHALGKVLELAPNSDWAHKARALAAQL